MKEPRERLQDKPSRESEETLGNQKDYLIKLTNKELKRAMTRVTAQVMEHPREVLPYVCPVFTLEFCKKVLTRSGLARLADIAQGH